MRRILGVLFGLVLLLPITIQGQTWTPEQQEVWERVETCWSARDIETISSCLHEDLVTWGLESPVPLNKADVVALNQRWLDTQETVWSYYQPLNIDVRGNTAVVIYAYHWAERNKITGEQTSGIVNWTEVFTKEGSQWLLLADHGSRVGGS
jgi:ketosteroid isomerase-like protein